VVARKLNTFHFAVGMKAVPKPRMTRADRWKVRADVVRYREFVDAVRAAAIDSKRRMGLPDDFKIATGVAVWIDFLPDMTVVVVESVERQARGKNAGDIDNLVKSVLEGLHSQKSGVEALVPILIEDDSQVVMLKADIQEHG